MPSFGYSLMCEEHHPTELVANAQRAEAAGFDFLTISDHFHPWLESQGHSPYAWAVLGALAATTDRAELFSLVIAVVQIGPDQEAFLRMWENDLAPRLAA